MGNTPSEDSAMIEEHLLVCDSCRERLVETEQYIRSMSHAATEYRRPATQPSSSWDLMRVFRLVVVAAGVILVAGLANRFIASRQPIVAVNLVATRAQGSQSTAPAGRTLRLHPDLTGLAAAPAYRIQVVNASGAEIWRGDLVPPADAVTLPAQRSGTHFVRIYTAGALLREYGLDIQ